MNLKDIVSIWMVNLWRKDVIENLENFKRWKVNCKFMAAVILPKCNCNDDGKRYLGKY